MQKLHGQTGGSGRTWVKGVLGKCDKSIRALLEQSEVGCILLIASCCDCVSLECDSVSVPGVGDVSVDASDKSSVASGAKHRSWMWKVNAALCSKANS